MDIQNIKIPTFKETWQEFETLHKHNKNFFFVRVNGFLFQYIDTYLYPLPFEFENSLMKSYSLNAKVRYLKQIMDKVGSHEIHSRIAENYPPYGTLFSVPENLDTLNIVFFVRDMQINNDELCALSYCSDLDCKIGELCCGKMQEDNDIFLLPKDFDSVHRKDITENGIYIGAKYIDNSAFKDKWQCGCRAHDIEKYPQLFCGNIVYFNKANRGIL